MPRKPYSAHLDGLLETIPGTAQACAKEKSMTNTTGAPSSKTVGTPAPGDCPFCGSHDTAQGWEYQTRVYIFCRRCGARGPWVMGDEIGAISSWNTRSPDETTALRETGWLIENGRPAPKTEYRGMDQMGIHWTADINKALRLARRADAEAFASGDVNAWAVVQHEWVIVDGDSIHAVEPSYKSQLPPTSLRLPMPPVKPPREPDLTCDGFVPDPHSSFCDKCGYPEREHRRTVKAGDKHGR